MGINAITMGIWAAGAASVKQAITATDPYWSNVVLLMHGDSLSDSGPLALALTNRGVAVSPQNAKYGAGALYFNGSSYLQTASLSSLNVSGINYTIETYVYLTAYGDVTYGSYVAQLFSGNEYRTALGIQYDGKPYAYSTNSTLNNSTISSVALQLNRWYHLAFTREGSTVRVFVDGVMTASATLDFSLANVAYKLEVGRNTAYSNWLYFNGYIDDVRITRGVARYTANFTPPSAQFPDG